MVYPSKRHRPGDDLPKMGRVHKRDVRQFVPRQNLSRPVVDVTVQVTASLVISVDVDANGVPTATTTLNLPPDVAAPVSSSLALAPAPTPAPAPAIFTTGPSSAAATPAPSSPASPASSVISAGSISRTSPTPTGGLLSSLSAGKLNSTSSIGASSSGPLPAIISVISGNNATIAVAGTSSRSSRASSSSSSLPSTPSSSSSLELSSSSLLSSSSSVLPSSTALPSSSSVDTSPMTPIVAGGGAAATLSPAATGIPNGARNGTTKPNDNSTSPPVVAGAVVGSVGGMAVILLVLVLVARWWKHHSRNSRYEDNASQLHLNGSDGAPTSRRSFLAAAGWLNRLSGTHQNRSSSPTLPPVAENERGFQKIAGRKLPSQFPTGSDEGPMARDFGASALPPMPATRAAHMSDTSSYHRDSRDTTHFFGAASQLSPMAHGAVDNRPSQHVQRRPDPERLVPELSPFDDAHSETLMPSPARTPQIHQYPDDPYFNNNQPPHSSWPVPEDAIRPAPRR